MCYFSNILLDFVMLNFVAIRKGINTAPGTSEWLNEPIIFHEKYLSLFISFRHFNAIQGMESDEKYFPGREKFQ